MKRPSGEEGERRRRRCYKTARYVYPVSEATEVFGGPEADLSEDQESSEWSS